MRPAKYHRLNQKWAQSVGKTGTVIAATFIRVADEKHHLSAPYSFVLADFEGESCELMGVGHEKIKTGDKVQCVLRKNLTTDRVGLIEHQLKVKKTK